MVASTKRSFRAASTGRMPSSMPAIIWGFTPRKIKSQARAISSLDAARAPGSSRHRAWAFSGVRLARYSAVPSGAPFWAARARAEPIFPVPIKPTH